jgi:hypothetical protein
VITRNLIKADRERQSCFACSSQKAIRSAGKSRVMQERGLGAVILVLFRRLLYGSMAAIRMPTAIAV